MAADLRRPPIRIPLLNLFRDYQHAIWRRNLADVIYGNKQTSNMCTVCARNMCTVRTHSAIFFFEAVQNRHVLQQVLGLCEIKT